MEGWTHARTRADDYVLLVSWGQPDFRDGMVPVALRAGCAMGMGLTFSFLASACLPACLVLHCTGLCQYLCLSRKGERFALLCFACHHAHMHFENILCCIIGYDRPWRWYSARSQYVVPSRMFSFSYLLSFALPPLPYSLLAFSCAAIG